MDEFAPLTFYGNTRWEDLSDATRELFVEVTGKAGTALPRPNAPPSTMLP